MTTNKGIRVVAVLEAVKGIVSLLVGFEVHALAGTNLRQLAESVVSHFHLNPASHLPSIFINAAGSLTDSKMMLLALGALVYSLVRLVEAYGLWRGLVWTEWFALVSGAIYLPFEFYEAVFHTNILGVSVLLINVCIVWYMVRILFNKRKEQTYISNS